MSDQGTVAEVRVAVAAAQAARATPGVVRLQPGLWGLVQRLAQRAWERATGQPYPDLGGVEVRLDDQVATIELTLVTDGRNRAVSVVTAVQRAVSAAVTAQTGLAVRSVTVHVCEIDINRPRSRGQVGAPQG